MQFTFSTAVEIRFGSGSLDTLAEHAAGHGNRALVFINHALFEQQDVVQWIEESFKKLTVRVNFIALPSAEPMADDIDRWTKMAQDLETQVIVAIGGGSTIDTAKAVSGMVNNPGCVRDYLEGVGKLTLRQPALPLIAIPTTAGTGSEVSKNAVLTVPEIKVKKSLRSPFLLPRLALLDPTLTLTLPPLLTAETGMDAVTQLIESYVSIKANPLTQTLCLKGIALAGRFLARAVQNGQDIEAREGMMLASLLSGMALANSGLGAAHGIAAALGGTSGVRHGRACAVLLPPVMNANLPVCVSAFAEIYRAFTGQSESNEWIAAEKAIAAVSDLARRIGIPERFDANEVDHRLAPALVRGAQGSSMKGNPKVLSDDEIEKIVRAVLSRN